jgi:3-hydroxybutyryl-CoA dehydrogenase
MMQHIEKVCICGAGTMGSGIAQACAASNYETVLYDADAAVVENAKNKIEEDLEKLIQKQKINEGQRKQILEKIIFASNISSCKADLIIEAIIENTEAKCLLFQQLEAINNDESVFASNTSSLSIAKIAESLNRKEGVIGLHFFNPAPLMKLVEVVVTKHTEETIIPNVLSFVKSLGKTPVLSKDSPGFIVNRVARPFYIESLRLTEEHAINFKIIDQLLEARGFKMGPFRLMDLIGNDINYAVSCSVYEQLNKPERLKPSLIQKERVEKGELGKKTGKGYYEY